MSKKLLSTERLTLLTLIVKNEKTEYFLDELRDFGVNFQLVVQGNGTATGFVTSKIFIELSETRSIICNILPEDKISQVMNFLNEKFNTLKDGKGIAFAIPISNIMGVNFYNVLSNNKSSFL